MFIKIPGTDDKFYEQIGYTNNHERNFRVEISRKQISLIKKAKQLKVTLERKSGLLFKKITTFGDVFIPVKNMIVESIERQEDGEVLGRSYNVIGRNNKRQIKAKLNIQCEPFEPVKSVKL